MQKEKAKEQASSCRVFLAPLFRTQFFFFNFDRPNDATSSKDRLSFLRLVNNQQGKMDPASRPPPPLSLSSPISLSSILASAPHHANQFEPFLLIVSLSLSLFLLIFVSCLVCLRLPLPVPYCVPFCNVFAFEYRYICVPPKLLVWFLLQIPSYDSTYSTSTHPLTFRYTQKDHYKVKDRNKERKKRREIEREREWRRQKEL